MSVSSQASARPTGAIVVGKWIFGLSLRISGLSQYLSCPVKIRASSSGVRVSFDTWLLVFASKMRNANTSLEASTGA